METGLTPSEQPTLPTQPPVQQDATPQPDAAPASRISGLDANHPAIKQFDDAFQDPAFLREIATSALKRGLPEGLAYLQHAHQMARENGVQAALALKAGDPERAVQLWNQRGQYNDATGAVDNGDGTYTISRQNGQQISVNPDQVIESALTPVEFMQNARQKALVGAQADYYKAHGRYMNAAADFQTDRAQMTRDVADTKAKSAEEVAHVRAEGLENAAKVRAIPQLVAQERIRATQEAADKYGPRAAWEKAAEQYRNPNVNMPNGADGKPLTPSEAATRDLIGHPDVDPVQNPNDPSEIVLVDARGNRVARIGTPDDFARITGRKFTPVQPAKAPAPAPAAGMTSRPVVAPKPATVAPKAPTPDLESALAQDKAARDAQSARTDAIKGSEDYQNAKASLVDAVKKGDVPAQKRLRKQMADLLAP